jgi:hypothetical protein
MSWNVKDCSERFETLARRIFRERRPPLLLRQIAGSQSLLGQMARWFQWLIHDSCYDSRIFDLALKSAFGEYRRIFGATRGDPPGPRRSGPRVGVVTTSISRDTNTFVVGNFNASQDAGGEPGKSDPLIILMHSFVNKSFEFFRLPNNTSCGFTKRANRLESVS